jgi:hypothetical protein
MKIDPSHNRRNVFIKENGVKIIKQILQIKDAHN